MDIFNLTASIVLDTTGYERGMSTAQTTASNTSKRLEDIGEAAIDASEDIETLGSGAIDASEDLEGLGESSEESSEGIGGLGEQSDSTKSKLGGLGDTSVSVGKLLKASLAGKALVSAISTAWNTITSSISDAIERYDTLNNYVTVMTNLGYSSDEAEAAVTRLSEGIQGLPTSLSDIVTVQEQFAALNGNIEESTELTLALNDATLAGGQGQETANSALQQWYQIIANGTPDLASWRIINQAMPAQLQMIAQECLGASATSQDLFNAWQDGTITTEEVMAAIVKLDQDGGDSFASFSEQALDANSGIATSITNLKTAVTRNVANIIEAYNDWADDNSMPTISEAIALIMEKINEVGSWVTDHIPQIMETIGNLAPVIAGVTAAVVAFQTAMAVSQTISAVSQAIKAYQLANEGATVAQALLNMTILANPLVLLVTLIAAAVAAIIVLWNTNDNFREAVTNAWEAIKNVITTVVNAISTVVTAVFDGLKTYFTAVFDAFKSIFETVITIWNNIYTTIEPILTAIQYLISTIFQAIQILISRAMTTIYNAVAPVFNAIYSVVSTVMNAVKSVISTVWNAIWNIISPILNTIKNGVSNAFNSVKTTISNILNTIRNLFSNLIGKATTWGKDLIQNFINGIKSKIQGVADAVTSVANKIKSIIGFSLPDDGPLSNADTYMPDFMDLLAKGINDNAGEVVDEALSLADAVSSTLSGDYTSNIAASTSLASSGDSTASSSTNFAQIFALLQEYLPKLANMQLVTDTGTLVGEIVGKMDTALGIEQGYRLRGN